MKNIKKLNEGSYEFKIKRIQLFLFFKIETIKQFFWKSVNLHLKMNRFQNKAVFKRRSLIILLSMKSLKCISTLQLNSDVFIFHYDKIYINSLDMPISTRRIFRVGKGYFWTKVFFLNQINSSDPIKGINYNSMRYLLIFNKCNLELWKHPPREGLPTYNKIIKTKWKILVHIKTIFFKHPVIKQAAGAWIAAWNWNLFRTSYFDKQLTFSRPIMSHWSVHLSASLWNYYRSNLRDQIG